MGTEEDGVDEARRSSKPPLMTVSAIDDTVTDTEATTVAVPIHGAGNGKTSASPGPAKPGA